LTEAVRRKPYCVILFDEIEKAHADVFNILLQLLDEGRLTDSHGRTVNFKNTVIIMTSNIGSNYLFEGIDRAGHISEEARKQVMAALRQQFRPEFLNRVDDTVLFKPLTEEELAKIVDLQVVELCQRLAERRIKLELTEAAKRFAARNGYDPVYGARPLKRFLQQELETPIARLLLSEGPVEGGTIAVDVKDDRLDVQLVPPAATSAGEPAPAEDSAPRKKIRK
jgi:ATP-dependent Clp protease ATP-binding subunit ClpB